MPKAPSLRRRLARLRRQVTGVPPTPPSRTERQDYFYLGPDLALKQLRDGRFLYVDPQDEHVSAVLIAFGAWEVDVQKAVRRLVRPGMRIVEVGANLGYYTMDMADLAGPTGHVTALEANPRLAAMVRRSAQFNGFLDRVSIIQKAASDRTGFLPFVISRTNSGGGYVDPWNDLSAYDDGERLDVEAVRLDELDLGRVDLIRTDAEGSEPAILRGAEGLLRANPDIQLCIEWDTIQMGSRGPVAYLANWLSSLGFRFWVIEAGGDLIERPASAMADVPPPCNLVLSRKPPRLTRSLG